MVGDYAPGLPQPPMMAARHESKEFDTAVQPYGVCVIVRARSSKHRRCGARPMHSAKIECPPHSTLRPPMHPRRIFGAHKHQTDCCRRPCNTVSPHHRHRGVLLTSPTRCSQLWDLERAGGRAGSGVVVRFTLGKALGPSCSRKNALCGPQPSGRAPSSFTFDTLHQKFKSHRGRIVVRQRP